MAATDEPKGTVLTDIDELVCLRSGTPIDTISGGKPAPLTRKIAIVQALETHEDAGDKFKTFDLGIRFSKANGSLAIDADESVLIKAALEKAWPQPGIYVPLCRWLEGQ